MKLSLFKKVLLSMAVFCIPTIVNAESANIAVVGKDNVTLGDIITLNLKINKIEDTQIVALGGNINFDSNYLTLVDTKQVNDNLSFVGNQINANNYRIAGLDYTLEKPVVKDTLVYEVTFKANKLGTTTINFEDGEVVSMNVKDIDYTTTSKTINIVEKEEKVETKEIVDTIKEVKTNTEVKTTKEITPSKEVKSIPTKKTTNVVKNDNKTELKTYNNTFVDRLKPYTFNKVVNGLNINDVKIYSIYNFKRQR